MTRPWVFGLACTLVLTASLALGAIGPRERESAPPAENSPLRFDFEQDIDGNNFPDEWVLLSGRRHPQNIRVKLDPTERVSGERSLLVELDGVTTVSETASAYPFDPKLSWHLGGFIKTEEVPSSGHRATSARLEVVGLGEDSGTVVFSARTTGVTDTSGWTPVGLDVPRDPSSPVRRVRIRCVVEGVALTGRVWFDDVTLGPRPTMRVRAGDPDGFFSPTDAPRVHVSLDTLIPCEGKNYALSAKLTGPGGAAVMSRTVDVAPSADFLADAELELPLTTFGEYLLETDVTSGARPVASSTRPLLYWPGSDGSRPPPDFGVYAGELSRLTPRLAAVLVESRLGAVAFDPFGASAGADNVPAPGRSAVSAFALLGSRRVQPVIVLGRVDESVVNRLFRENRLPLTGETTWVRVLALEPKYWASELAATVGPFAARTTYWQIGPAHDPGASPDDLTRAVKQLRTALAPLSYRPKIGVTLKGTEPGGFLAALKGCDFAVLDGPAWTQTERDLTANMARLKSAVDEVWVTVPVPDGQGKPGAAADELTRRAIRAKAAGADRVMFAPLVGGLLDATQDARDTLSAASTLARELGGKRFVGVPGKDPRLSLFVGPSGARLAVIPSPNGLAEVTYLGKTPRRIDLDGNATRLLTGAGIAVLQNDGRPCFIDGLDVETLSLRRSPQASR